jgi:hypothetical protein
MILGCTEPTLDEMSRLPAVTGLDLSRVSLNQAVDIPIMNGFENPRGNEATILTGREALVRAFVEPQEAWKPRWVTAWLTLTSAEGTVSYQDVKYIEGDSKTPNLETSLNFRVEGGDIDLDTTFDISLHESTPWAWKTGTSEKSAWSSENAGGFEIEEGGTIKVVIIPIRYNADGSGRLPVLTDKQLDRYEELISAVYPLKKLKLKVDDPLDVSYPIDPFGSGWYELLAEIAWMRQLGAEDENTYYYGLFSPDVSLDRYCSSGCILGLSNVGTTSDPWSRSSIGLGFKGENSAETKVQEIGHAHGREHSPCGLFGQPSDPSYPYDEATLGVWGWDRRTDEMLKPSDHLDMMSYCYPLWVSDYTYAALTQRIRVLDRDNRSASLGMWSLSVVRGDGSVHTVGDIPVGAMPSGTPTSLALLDSEGRTLTTTTGYLSPLSHLPGGMLVHPHATAEYHHIKLIEPLP